MKIIELFGDLRLPIFNEEVDVVKKVKNKKLTEVSQLSDREREIVLGLIRKNVLRLEENQIFFNGPEVLDNV